MRSIEEYRTTANRYVYNRIRKEYVASCTYCPYHRGENSKNKWYGKIEATRSWQRDSHRAPSWKLSTTGKRQWERWKRKPLRQFSYGYTYRLVQEW